MIILCHRRAQTFHSVTQSTGVVGDLYLGEREKHWLLLVSTSKLRNTNKGLTKNTVKV